MRSNQMKLYPKAVIIWFITLYTIVACASQQSEQKVIFETQTGKHSFKLEVAETEKEKAKGLMFRKHLDQDKGMVFIYHFPQYAGIWMKNTEIPLDIIFIDCNNNVIDFVTRQPHTEHVSYAPQKICKIIELNAGLTEKMQLQIDNKVHFIPKIE